MATCTHCGKPVGDAAFFCLECGSRQRVPDMEVTEIQNSVSKPAMHAPTNGRVVPYSPPSSPVSDFLAFRTMVTPLIMKITYFVGTLVLTIFAIYTMAQAGTSQTCTSLGYCTSASSNLVIGILLLTVGNLTWRLLCEGGIVFFSIHERLRRIERNTTSSVGRDAWDSSVPLATVAENVVE